MEELRLPWRMSRWRMPARSTRKEGNYYTLRMEKGQKDTTPLLYTNVYSALQSHFDLLISPKLRVYNQRLKLTLKLVSPSFHVTSDDVSVSTNSPSRRASPLDVLSLILINFVLSIIVFDPSTFNNNVLLPQPRLS